MAVSLDDLWVAIHWLDVNEGAEDAPACARVARFLEAEMAKREKRNAGGRVQRAVEKAAGRKVPLRELREMLKRDSLRGT
jgi:hypothetical protein